MAAIIDDETLQMYIQESKEHLEDIESDLLKIEQQGENVDTELINKVFRAAHSIKGGGGFLNLQTIKELAHKIENILDLIRNHQMAPSSNIVNTVLKAFDHLGLLLDNALGSNDMDIAEHLAALSGLTASSLPAEEKGSLKTMVEIRHPHGDQVFTVSEFDLKQSRQGGKHLYLLEFDLIRDVERRGKTPLDVIKRLEDTGITLDTAVSLAMVGDLDDEEIGTRIPMYVLYSSVIEADLIGSVMGLPDTAIHAIAEGTNVTVPLATTAAAPSPTPTPAAPPKPVLPASPAAPAQPQAAPTGKAEVVNKKPAKAGQGSTDTIRVNVSVLDQLMNRAGELVLARNQLVAAIRSGDRQTVSAAGQRIDLVTSELQETIMMTRMQPVGNIFNKFPRVVRDMAQTLGKDMELELDGQGVELDKTIIESLGDPLTHLVRNAADHGIEPPAERQAKGKASGGRILLRALHESGQVIIEIHDDGRGLDPERIAAKAVDKGLITAKQAAAMSDSEKINLIMLPGLSTAEQITDVSGRGVGMDVVKTNLDQLGGQVEIHSVLGQGTVIRIKLPLTLAIIACLLVSSGKERFAIPQVNVGELLQIPAAEVRERIEKVGDAEVLILRGELIPLLQLSNILELQRTFYNPRTGAYESDKRQQLADERVLKAGEEASAAAEPSERRANFRSDIKIVVVQAGIHKYGLVVDTLHDTVEIVVKPLDRYLNKLEVYAGATIMGDGHVALILDISGLARVAELHSLAESDRAKQLTQEKARLSAGTTRQSLLIFHNGPEEYCAVPLHLVLRVEQIKSRDIEMRGGKKLIHYRGGSLPVYALEEVARVEALENREDLIVIVFVVAGHELGLLAVPPLDVLELDLAVDEETLRQPGISGSAIIRGETTLLIDIFGFVQAVNPQWFAERQQERRAEAEGQQGGGKAVLLVEDSQFFRDQVRHFIENEGYTVLTAADGVEALEVLSGNLADIGLVVTDLEMPNMDGFALARRIKGDERLRHLPVIALTSLAGEADMAKGRAAGIDDYQIKLDKENLLTAIRATLGTR